LAPVRQSIRFVDVVAVEACAPAESHLTPRPEPSPARKNIAPFELFRYAAVLVIRGIAPVNW
jgi:hypothetical protein